MSKITDIEFVKLPINKSYGKPLFNVYYIVENNRTFMENFWNLDQDTKDNIKALILRMATVKDFKSNQIRSILHGYSYGEIKPKPHRFFYFLKCGNNIIFFSYTNKKKDSLKDEFYKRLEKDKNKYAEEFEQFIKRN